MTAGDAIPLTLFGLIVALTALGGIFGPPVILVPAGGLAVLWVVMLVGHSRDQR